MDPTEAGTERRCAEVIFLRRINIESKGLQLSSWGDPYACGSKQRSKVEGEGNKTYLSKEQRPRVCHRLSDSVWGEVELLNA